MRTASVARYLRLAQLAAIVYCFLLSIQLLGHAFTMFGAGFAAAMLQMTANPYVGLLTGIVATSLIQSSSTTTSIVVGMVAGGALSLPNAIPIIMGANIGTTITNTLVSLGHVTQRIEFRRAFGASVVHDLFNICAVAALFPLELRFRLLERTATYLESVFAGAGGLQLFNPLKSITQPAAQAVKALVGVLPHASVFLMVLALAMMFAALTLLVRTLRSMMLNRMEVIIQRYLFRNDAVGLLLGLAMTMVVQSSSITTSIIVPLAGAGLVSIRQLFPYTLGANLGTTVTAILAALATQNHVAVTVAFAHLMFNVLGMAIFYPLKLVPIRLAEIVADIATRSRRHMLACIAVYLMLYFVPALFVFLT